MYRCLLMYVCTYVCGNAYWGNMYVLYECIIGYIFELVYTYYCLQDL